MLNLIPSSQRLLFKELKESDLHTFHQLINDEFIRNFLMEGMDISEQDCKKWIEESILLQQKIGLGLYLISYQDEIIGYCGFKDFDDQGTKIQIIYAFPEEKSGKGFATEACQALVDLVKKINYLDKLVAIVAPRNIQSVRVLKKVGFIFKGKAEGELSHLDFFFYKN